MNLLTYSKEDLVFVWPEWPLQVPFQIRCHYMENCALTVLHGSYLPIFAKRYKSVYQVGESNTNLITNGLKIEEKHLILLKLLLKPNIGAWFVGMHEMICTQGRNGLMITTLHTAPIFLVFPGSKILLLLIIFLCISQLLAHVKWHLDYLRISKMVRQLFHLVKISRSLTT